MTLHLKTFKADRLFILQVIETVSDLLGSRPGIGFKAGPLSRLKLNSKAVIGDKGWIILRSDFDIVAVIGRYLLAIPGFSLTQKSLDTP